MIRIINLSFKYDESEIRALNGINMEAHKGELLFIIGGDLSGKSTLLLCMAGIIPNLVTGEYGGDVTVNNINIRKNFVQQDHVGIVFQDSDVYLFEEVFQEIAYPLVNRRISKEEIKKRVHDISDMLGIGHLIARSMSTLSGGERQKVAIAAAFAAKSSVLLLDEPFEQLDPDAAHEVMKVLRGMAEEGKTVIITGKKMDFAERYADRILLLDNGKILKSLQKNVAGND